MVYVGDVEEVSTSGSTTTTTAYYYASGKRIGLSVNGSISYLAADGLGSATASQLFGPYGSVRYQSGTMPTSYGFTGQRADATSGLDYYGARYYDPAAGQFTSADSVLPGSGYDLWGLSRYAYVEGNPVSRTDPSGHCFCDSPGSGDNFFPQSGGRLLDGETGEVFSGPSYSYVYHLDWSGYHPHHYQRRTARPASAPVSPPTHSRATPASPAERHLSHAPYHVPQLTVIARRHPDRHRRLT